VSVAPSFDPNARDSDKDGIVDGMDRCVKEAEDLDNFQDADGCPDPDNDADAIPDAQDQCPDDPEDDDGWLDNDGCPDPDNDKDGILDVADRCPSNPETINGYQDEDGCPDDKPVDDTDGDGYKDDVDRCPYDAEDFDNFEDEDGCPELDNDTDGINDVDDSCPLEREVYNGVDDEDGCPDEGRVVVESSRIKIMDQIFFDFNKATIQTRSFSLLDEIAATIKGHPTLLKIRVEGHTDNVGGGDFNRKLSEARAQAVMNYIVASGIETGRLDARGFGEDYPIDTNATDAGRANNRRVEFIIVDQE
jgi:outer membrane protein OmpA-like peptidoglycan-associated protein